MNALRKLKKDLSGTYFNNWLAVSPAPATQDGPSKKPFRYNCMCKCGTRRTVLADALASGRSKSCGCNRKEKAARNIGNGNFNSLYRMYKRRAELVNREFSIPQTMFRELTSSPCHYCLAPPSNRTKTQATGFNGYYIYNGLDRQDSSQGYTPANVVPCCKNCNYAKHSMTLDQFRSWVRRISLNKDNF
jgi:hypothetical protein